MSNMDQDEFDRLLSEVDNMDDDALDAMVVRMSSDYNAPPAGFMRPPVEAMWTHIAAAQRPAKRGFTVQRWQLLAASVAFVAFGITIGRQWSDLAIDHAHTGAPVTRVMPATAPSTTASPDSSARVADITAGSADEPTEITTPVASHATDGAHPRTPSVRTPGHAAPRANGDAPSVANAPGSRIATGNDAAYQLATMRHFAAAEALLASYDGSAHDAKADAQLASWATDLLSQTRLLLDSPAGRDPGRRRLLQDLELVLVQMAQLGPNSPKLEHDLIDGSVRHNDIITRLRTAVPAGATTAL